MRICIHDWQLYHVTLLQGSALWTTEGSTPNFHTNLAKCVKMTFFLQEHSPLVMFQVDSLFCTMSIQIKEHTAKKDLKFSVIRSTL